MLIKILKSFTLKGTKYEPKQNISLTETEEKNIFWRNRIKDKDVEIVEKQIDVEIVEKQINKK